MKTIEKIVKDFEKKGKTVLLHNGKCSKTKETKRK